MGDDTVMKAIGVEKILTGEYLSYYKIKYLNNANKVKTYEMVSKQGSRFNNSADLTIETIGNKPADAVILLVLNTEHTKMLVSKEFRLGVNKVVYGDVAGMVDAGETPEQAAKRELYEETGLILTNIIDKLNPTYTCAPVTDELTYMIICEAEGEIRGSDSSNEEIQAIWVDKQEMLKLLSEDSIIFSGRMQAFAYMWAHGLN